MKRLSSDTALCQNHRCPERGNCLRYLSQPHDRQTYADFKVPLNKTRCEAFIPAYQENR